MDDGAEGLLQSGFRYACSLTHQPAEAEDLVQEAWIKLARGDRRVWSKALIFTTIRHLFIDRYRHNRLMLLEPLDDVPETPVFSERPFSAQQQSEQEVAMDIQFLEHALSALRVEEREAVYLHLVEGYTAAEISGLTERSRNTVLSLIHRGRQKLVLALNHGEPTMAGQPPRRTKTSE